MLEQLNEISRGKRVAGRLYLHGSCLALLPAELQDILRQSGPSNLALSDSHWVLKICTRTGAFSFLRYPDFWQAGFPRLVEARSGVLDEPFALTVRHYNGDDRPVLHRKELLIDPAHPKFRDFSQLSLIAEKAGLFFDASRIGYSRYWETLLTSRGLIEDGHSLVDAESRQALRLANEDAAIARHRTALRRQYLSQPIQQLFRFDLLKCGTTFFDYGCGQGDDVNALRDEGLDASGWDPYFAPEETRQPADIVNLGYVLNVIEDPDERIEVLRDAFRFAKRLLVVSVLIGQPRYANSQRHGDGWLTSRGTFQKYFLPDEITGFLDQVLGTEVTVVQRGIYFVFCDEELREAFLLSRLQARARTQQGLPARPQINLETILEQSPAAVEEYWGTCLALGRRAVAEDFEDTATLERLRINPSRLFVLLVAEDRRSKEYEESRARRRDTLITEFALTAFERPVFFKRLDPSLQRDIRALFGNYRALQDQAREAFHSIADEARIARSALTASQDGLGFLFSNHALMLHADLLDRLDPVLRIYVRAAMRLSGEGDSSDLVKLHLQSGKVSFLSYDDFEGAAVPNLVERIKVSLRTRRVEYFDYIGPYEAQPLLFKSLFISEAFPGFSDQEAFDDALSRTKLFYPAERGPGYSAFKKTLADNGYRIDGFQLLQTS